MATERITILVKDKGTRTVKRNLDAVGRSATTASAGVKRLGLALGAVAGGIAVRGIVSQINKYQELSNRIKSVTGSAREFTAVQKELRAVARRSRADITSTTEGYARFANALQGTGTTAGEITRVIETLNKGLVVSGATTAEVSSVMVQLSQGLASGALRGDELRSVLEAGPVVARLFAKELGVTVGQLRDMGKEGKITRDVMINALVNGAEEIEAKFAKTSTTVTQAFVQMKNVVLEVFGSIEQTGFGQGIVNTINLMTQGIQHLHQTAGPTFRQIGEALRVIFGVFGQLKAIIQETTGVNINFGQVAGQVFQLWLDTLTNVAAAIGTLPTAIQNFGSIAIDAINLVIGALNGLISAAVGAGQAINNALAGLPGAGALGITAGASGGEGAPQIPTVAGGGGTQNVVAKFSELKLQIQQAGAAATVAKGPLLGLNQTVAGTGKESSAAEIELMKLKAAEDAAASGASNLASASRAGAGGVKELGNAAAESSSFIEDAFQSAFSKASDAIAEFVATGKFDIKALTQSILKDITKMALNSAFKQVFGGGGGGGGGIFGMMGGGGGGGLFGGGGGGGGGLFGGLGGLFGFAEGGAFQVGGSSGRDNNLMSINGRPVAKVSRGETVNVSPQGSVGGGNGVTINYNISTPNADSFGESQSQLQAQAFATASRASRRNN